MDWAPREDAADRNADVNRPSQSAPEFSPLITGLLAPIPSISNPPDWPVPTMARDTRHDFRYEFSLSACPEFDTDSGQEEVERREDDDVSSDVRGTLSTSDETSVAPEAMTKQTLRKPSHSSSTDLGCIPSTNVGATPTLSVGMHAHPSISQPLPSTSSSIAASNAQIPPPSTQQGTPVVTATISATRIAPLPSPSSSATMAPAMVVSSADPSSSRVQTTRPIISESICAPTDPKKVLPKVEVVPEPMAEKEIPTLRRIRSHDASSKGTLETATTPSTPRSPPGVSKIIVKKTPRKPTNLSVESSIVPWTSAVSTHTPETSSTPLSSGDKTPAKANAKKHLKKRTDLSMESSIALAAASSATLSAGTSNTPTSAPGLSHTKMCRDRLNSMFEKLKSTLPPAPHGVEVKHKAQILDYAIMVLTGMVERTSQLEIELAVSSNKATMDWISKLVARIDSFPDAAEEVMRLFAKRRGWMHAELWTASNGGASISSLGIESDDSLKISFCRAVTPDEVCEQSVTSLVAFSKESENIKFAPGEGVPGRVWSSMRPEWLTGLSDPKNFCRADLARKYGVKVCMAVPVTITGKIEGIMCFYDIKHRPYDTQCLELAMRLAWALGNAIGGIRAKVNYINTSGTSGS